jgi:putative intracellular protease/amidase
MRWLFHALPSEAIVPERYAPESLDREGFVHASYRDTVLESVRLHMPDAGGVDVLQIDPRRLDVVVTPADTPRGPMPHVHGAIPADSIVARFSLADFAARVSALPDRVTGTRFAFLAFEGMTLLDLVGVYDPLSRIASMGFDATSSCEIVGAHRGRVWAHGGAELTLDRVRPPLADVDALIVPGGPGTRVLVHDPSLTEWLATYPPNRLLASVCTGALLLGAAGRLRGKRATTHHGFLDRLEGFGAKIERARVVDDGQLVTAAGVTSALDLGIHLVRRLEGDDVADKIAAQIEWQEP